MAIRAFNKVNINGEEIPMKDFLNGTGVINIIGVDLQEVTDDHKVHNLRINQKSKAQFTLFKDYTRLNTNPVLNNFGGEHIFYLDNSIIARFNGIVTAEFDEEKRETVINIDEEVPDAG